MISDPASDLLIPCTNVGVAPKMFGGFTLSPGQTTKVPLSFVSQFGWDTALKFDYGDLGHLMSTRNEVGAFTFDWWCPLSMVDGYGRHALSLFKGFQGLGCEPILRDVGWIDKLFLGSYFEAERYKGMYRVPSKIGAVMSLPYDDHVHNHQSIHKIVITQFETSRIPEKHIQNVNLCDHLIVTSHYQPKVWRRSGCRIPISVMTPGVDTDEFGYQERVPDGKFKVLLLGAITERKNPLGAIRIFQQASDGRHDWRLTIKTRKTDAISKISQVAIRDSRINIEVGDSHPDLIKQYYYTHDCLLWPSKGEGVGLPPLEAMSTGMELVCSANSGMLDYVNDAHCYSIKTSHMEPADGPGGFSHDTIGKDGNVVPGYVEMFGAVGEWWVPDEDHAIKQLRRCFDHWAQGSGKGRLGAEYVRKYHTLASQASSVLKILMKYE